MHRCDSLFASVGKGLLVTGLSVEPSKVEVSSQSNGLLTSDTIHDMVGGKITNVLIWCFISVLHRWTGLLDISKMQSCGSEQDVL